MSSTSNFLPDTSLVDFVVPAANTEPRREGFRPIILLLHYTGMPSVEAAIHWLSVRESGVSCHYVVSDTGAVTQMVPETLRAWHAGVSHWQGINDINSCSIGIEIHNPGHDGGYPDFPDVQMQAVEALCSDIVRRRGIEPHRVLAHSDVAPRRKIDPGEKFDWARLALGGVGHWVAPAPLADGDALTIGMRSDAVLRLQENLQAYGYGTGITGEYDADTRTIVSAFQRHFRPSLVDGRADLSTLMTLDALLAALPKE